MIHQGYIEERKMENRLLIYKRIARLPISRATESHPMSILRRIKVIKLFHSSDDSDRSERNSRISL